MNKMIPSNMSNIEAYHFKLALFAKTNVNTSETDMGGITRGDFF